MGRCAMGLHARICFTAAQKAELWERWKNEQSASAISRALERKNKTGVERIVVLHGGIGPGPRRRALAALRFGCGLLGDNASVSTARPNSLNFLSKLIAS